MAEHAGRISLQNLQTQVPHWQADEAIALVAQVGDRLQWRCAPPGTDAIFVRADGVVDVGVAVAAPATAAAYAELLHRLLPEPEPGRPGKVPGAVRVLVARGMGQTALPPLASALAFGDRLKRASPQDGRVVLANLVRRAMATTRGATNARTRDRRASGRSVEDLRRQLLEADLDRWALVQQMTRAAQDLTPRPVVSFASAARRHAAAARHQTGSRAISADAAEIPRGSRWPAAFRPVARAARSRVARAGATALAILLLLSFAFAGGFGWGWLRMRRADTLQRAAAISESERSHSSISAGAASQRASSPAAAESGTASGPAASIPAQPLPAVPRILAPIAIQDAESYSPSFGADTETVFFHADYRDGTRLMKARTDAGGHAVSMGTLLADHARNYHVRVSPNGLRLAYDSDRDGVRGIYVAPIDGEPGERVSGEGYAAVPAWAPDSRRLAFVRADPNRPRVWNLAVLDLDSRDERPLTHFSAGQAWPGNWFHDGRRLVYTHETRLYVLDTSTGRARSFPSPVPGRLLRTASVSPDGRRIAFQVYRDGLWRLDLASGRMTRLLADPSAEEFTWSADGSRLAFHSHRGGRWRVWTMVAPR